MKKYLLVFKVLFLVTGIAAQTPRLSLVEEFTGETCGPCAAVNPGVNAVLAKPLNRKRVVPIKWQVPIPSAPTNTWSLYQTNKTEINWRYRSVANGGYGYNNGAGINSAPHFLFDGWWPMPGAITTSDCAVAQSYTSAFSITMDREWDATQSSVNLTVSIKATANFNATGNLIFRTVMVERHIQFPTQPGNNGETEFHDAAIKSFPTLQGGIAMAGNWTTGQTQTFTLNCPLPSYTRKKEEVAFVGFIQDDGNRKVAQAVRSEKQGTGLNDMEMVSMNPPPGLICNGSVARVIVVRNNGSNTITDFTMTPYVDAVPQTPVTWSGVLTNGAYKTLTLTPYVPNMGGGHTLSCKITGVSGGDSDPLNNETAISFYSGSAVTGTLVTEGYTGTFPPPNWGIINPDEAIGWTKSTSAGGFGLSSESAFYEGVLNDRGDVDEMILPPMDLTGTADPDMQFDVAYARRYYRSDTLEVLASSDCGATWTLVFRKQDSILSTIQYAMASYFIPSPSQWRKETFTLPGFNKPNVLVKFRVKNDAGNNIFVDNVNLIQSQPLPSVVGISSQAPQDESITLYPNPASGSVHTSISAGEPSSATLTLLSPTGQVLLVNATTLNTGTTTVDLDLNGFAAGLYHLTITTKDQTVVKKLCLIK